MKNLLSLQIMQAEITTKNWNYEWVMWIIECVCDLLWVTCMDGYNCDRNLDGELFRSNETQNYSFMYFCRESD